MPGRVLAARIAEVRWFDAGQSYNCGPILADLIGHFVEVSTGKMMRMRMKLDVDALSGERRDLLFS
jgi:hypothetical protein